mmetsp:Transcript_37656/g.120042  ORF Transcript_37656/g.120042 Transcript_37656/m.120042 type:complete len:215 (+) Transcript_37656:212-856(+)
MVSECQQDVLQPAYCSSDISRLLGAIGEMTAGATAISVQCTEDGVAGLQDGADDAGAIERRLASSGGDGKVTLKAMFDKLRSDQDSKKQAEKELELQHASCGVDISQAVLFVARVGAEIQGAHHHCTLGGKQDVICWGDIGGMLAALGLVSMMVSNAVGECPAIFDVRAVCASAISQLASGIFELTSSGLLMTESCSGVEHQHDLSTYSDDDDE